LIYALFSRIFTSFVVKPGFNSADFVDYCATKGKVEIDGVMRTVLNAPMAGFYKSNAGEENPGIYEEHINCNVENKVMIVSSSFHVSAGLNLVAEIFTTQQTQFQRVINDILVTQEMLSKSLENITNRMENVEFRLNESIEENQASLLDKFSRMGGAIESIFGDNSSV